MVLQEAFLARKNWGYSDSTVLAWLEQAMETLVFNGETPSVDNLLNEYDRHRGISIVISEEFGE